MKIEGIDINIVEKEVKYKEDLWVNSQVKSGLPPMVARSTRYPKESKLKDIPIVKGKGEDVLLHDYLTKEKKEEPRNATTTFKKIEEDKNVDNSNGYSSGYVTDPEKVNPNDEPMDYQASSWSEDEDSLSESSISGSSNSSPESDGENTRIRLRKRKSPEPVDEGNPTKKSSRSGSGNSSSEEAGGSPRSNFSDFEPELCMEFRGANLGSK